MAFHDSTFTQERALLGTTYKRPPSWRAASALRKGRRLPLFHAIHPDSLRQGELGDCWLLAGMAALAEFPEEVEALFISQASPEASPAGRYTVRLYDKKLQSVRDIEVDEFVPCINLPPNQYIKDYQHLAHVPLFAKPVDDIWPLIVEKAMAKMRGSYESLTGGFEAEAFRALTGCTKQENWERRGTEWQNEFLVETEANAWRRGGERADSRRMWELVERYIGEHFLMGASIRGSGGQERRRPDGLVEGHACATTAARTRDLH
jgi:calpain-15